MTKTPLRILCFGDSLTEGYSSWGMVMTPYSHWLSSYLNAALDSEYEITIETDGKSGDLVTTGFETRMNRYYPPNTTTNQYDWIIYLGGTNDLAYRRTPSQILSCTQEALSLPLSLGVKILIMTIPECKSQMVDKQRNELNELIRSWGEVEEGKKGKEQDVWVFDLWQKMKFHGISAQERNERWDDGLHFTPKGYECIGEMVGRRLVEILKQGKM